MAPQEPGLPSGRDERTPRVYEGVVTAPCEDNPFLDLDHGFEVTPSGSKRHVWTDSSCWLKDLSGKRVRITVEVIEEERTVCRQCNVPFGNEEDLLRHLRLLLRDGIIVPAAAKQLRELTSTRLAESGDAAGRK